MRPNFSGTWRLNAAKSNLLGPPPSSDVSILHNEPYFESTMMARRSGGEEVSVVFRGNTSGGQFDNKLGSNTVHSRAAWEDDELKIESWMEVNGRQAHFCDYWFFADGGGSTLIMEHRDDDLAGQRSVLERVDAAAEHRHE